MRCTNNDHCHASYRGVSDEELGAFVGAGDKDVPPDHWRTIIGWTELSTQKDQFRVLETSVLEIN